MICQSTYDSLDQIPEAFRDEFENKNGKYVLKADAIPGVGDLFNASIAANRDRAMDQLKAANTRKTELERQLQEAKDNSADALPPGSKVLSAEDAKAWERYTKLGAVKELEAIVAKIPELERKVQETELAASLAIFKDSGLNNEVLTEWLATTKDAKLSAFLKDGKVKDAKGNIVDGKIPMLKVETPEAGSNKVKVEEVELLPYAQTNLPAWKYQALITPAPAQTGATGSTSTVAQPAPTGQPVIGQPATGGVLLPSQSSASTGNGGGGSGEKKNYAQKFNQEREKQGANPFVTPTPAATQQS